MKVIYTGEPMPTSFAKSLFLAGPTPRSSMFFSWREEALRILHQLNYDGVVFVPEYSDPSDYDPSTVDYDERADWENEAMEHSDVILFWMNTDPGNMPGLTTRDEWGAQKNSGKVVFGAPENAYKTRYAEHWAHKLNIPIARSLEEVIGKALELIGEGSLRSGAECKVPLQIWNTQSFQGWYGALVSAGNKLNNLKVEWTFRVGPKRTIVLFWALHVDIYITAENRNKTNEVVICRPDITSIVMYYPQDEFEDTLVVLVKEFRSPGCTSKDGFVYEVPGGSSFKPEAPEVTVVKEAKAETGLDIDPRRVVTHESRQLSATTSAHKSHVFSIELTRDELMQLWAKQGEPQGDASETKLTYVYVLPFFAIRRQYLTDWSNLGMLYQVLTERLGTTM